MHSGAQPNQEQLDLGSGLESALREIRSLTEKLLQIIHSLPKVEADGSSECPFARELYAKKEKMEQQLIGRLAMLHMYLAAVEKELARCKGNLGVISAHQTMLNRDEPKRMYSEAEIAQAAEYKRYIQKRDDIRETLALVEQALAEGSPHQYPGGADRDEPGTSVPSGFSPGAGDSSGDPSVGEELEQLLSLGPVGKKAFRSAI